MTKFIFIFLITKLNGQKSIKYNAGPECYDLENLYEVEFTQVELGCVPWDEQTGYPNMRNKNYGNYCRLLY